MYNVNTRGIHTSNVILGMALFGGGLVQLLAGMWEFPRGNVFGATGRLLADIVASRQYFAFIVF
jgi:succinate-acetate transporter protein